MSNRSPYSFSTIPTVNDDISKGYVVRDTWETGTETYKCESNTLGAAVWRRQPTLTEIINLQNQINQVRFTNLTQNI